MVRRTVDARGENEPIVERGLRAAAKWLLDRPPLFLLSMMHNDMPGLAPEHRNVLIEKSYGVVMRPIVDLVIQAQRRGHVREIEPHVVAGGFLSVIEGIVVAWDSGLGADPHQSALASISMLVHGIETEPTERTEPTEPT